jgi:3-hydroxyisobutyrate dehydrogenase-like beta-hydroxyacid dehydrogenase
VLRTVIKKRGDSMSDEVKQGSQGKLGFIGVGVMGGPMASNLMRAGFELTIFDPTRSQCEKLVPLGAHIADSPCGVAVASDVVITMVPDTAVVEQVLFGLNGAAGGLKPGAVVIDMSTISPTATVEFGKRLEALGCSMLDAPVSGGPTGAIEGGLGMMVGGPREIFDRCLPCFRCMGKTITYTGPLGNGQKTKLVNQLVGATNLLGAVEGLRLARKAGLDVPTTLQAVMSGAANSWMVANLLPLILKNDFSPGFAIRLQHKDLRLLTEWVDSLGGEFPAAHMVYSLFSRAMEMGLQGQGNQGLINIWKD